MFRLLKQINYRTRGGVIWSGNPFARNLAFQVFHGINLSGGL